MGVRSAPSLISDARALLAGQSVSQVAAEYRLQKGTVSSWNHRIASPIAANAVDATQKSAAIGELLMDRRRKPRSGLGIALEQQSPSVPRT